MRGILIAAMAMLATALMAQTNDWEDSLVVTQKTIGVKVERTIFESDGGGKTTVVVTWRVLPDTNTVANTNAIMRWARFAKNEWNTARGTNGPTVKEVERSAVKLAKEASR